MKKAIYILICSIVSVFFLSYNASAQIYNIDSLKSVLLKEADTLKVKTMLGIASAYSKKSIYDTALSYYLGALKLAENTQDTSSLFISLYGVAHFYENIDNHAMALEFGLRAQKIAEEQKNKQRMFEIYDFIGDFICFNQGKFDTCLLYDQMMMTIAQEMKDKEKIAYVQLSYADIYRGQQKFSNAIEITQAALKTSRELDDKEKIFFCLHGFGLIYAQQGKYKDATPYYIAAYKEAEKNNIDISGDYGNFIDAYFALGKFDSALLFANKFLNSSLKGNFRQEKMYAYSALEKIYAAKDNFKEAFRYLHLYQRLKDSLNSIATQNKMDLVEFAYKTDKQNKEIELLQKNSELQVLLRNALIITAVLLMATAFLIANRYIHKRKAGTALTNKNTELSKALDELKSTQAQLIQSEKMASLGELTAGIAHEIQNPLNFVNNFSEMNTELIAEMKEEITKGNLDEVTALATDIELNEQKILHHGKRADNIVKGMLQHSRKSAGQKEPTDINKLADEYLRLAYQGLRAKDKSFNAMLKTDFDDSIGKINIIPQDIGRVLLNLFNNAFYATSERQKVEGEGFKPVVSISTKLIKPPLGPARAGTDGGVGVCIVVADNGTGIPDSIKNKIMQPFFTTKPTGQGTGLGLSLSYDIVKSHGGEITVETKESEGTEFIISLPFKV